MDLRTFAPYAAAIVAAALFEAARAAARRIKRTKTVSKSIWIDFPDGHGISRIPFCNFVRLVGPSSANPDFVHVVHLDRGGRERQFRIECSHDAALAAVGRAVRERDETAITPSRFAELAPGCFVRPGLVIAVREAGPLMCSVDVRGSLVRYVVERPAADVVADVERALAS